MVRHLSGRAHVTTRSGPPRIGCVASGQRARCRSRALATLDLTGYAARRNEVLPRSRRGATRLSPYIRHARHLSARVGRRNALLLRLQLSGKRVVFLAETPADLRPGGLVNPDASLGL